MTHSHILNVGYEPILLLTRSMVLRQAGYVVIESSVLAEMLSKVDSDFIDVVLICNSVSRREQEWLVRQIMNKRCLLPILCIKNNPYDGTVPGCTGIENEPAALLSAVELSLKGIV